MEKEELIEFLKKEGYYNLREIPNRGLCGLRQFIFTVGLVEGLGEHSYNGRYCYPNELIKDSVIAIELWDGEGDPIGGWIKHKGFRGEYNNPNKE